MAEQRESAIARHDRMVREERDQAERVRTDRADEDIWKPHARYFGGANEPEHVAVEALASLTDPNATVIDVGAGGGRITLPLARRVREMIAVEPSPSMRDVLEAEVERAGIDNLRIVPSTWEEAEVQPAELVFAANVTYGIQDIEPFLRKLDRVATHRAALVAFADPPQYQVAPFWKHVYGEERLRLPCRDELVDALHELGAEPQLIELPAQQPRPFGSPEQAFEELRRRLFIGSGNSHEERLREAISRLAVERNGELWPVESHPNERAVIWWEPAMHTTHVAG